MKKAKRIKLSDAEKNYILLLGKRGAEGSHTEFAPDRVRKVTRRLKAKGLIQWNWRANVWMLTPRDGYAEYQNLILEFAKRDAA